MTTLPAAALFILSLSVTLIAARLFARRLDSLGLRLGFPEALTGLLTALAADGPEISSALFALARGEHGVGVGVLVGSNAFNIAAMIGISGLLAGCVRLSRETLALEGLVGAAITAIGIALLLRWLSPLAAVVAAACFVVPYLVVVIGGSELLAHMWGGEHTITRVAHALEQRPPAGTDREPSSRATHHLLGLIALDVLVIVAGSAGMVEGALTLGGAWHISNAVLGMLILGPLTSIPNAITGVRLGLAGRGAALVGEALNSNSLNMGAGVIVPSLFVTFAALSAVEKLQLWWLLAMTMACLCLLVPRRGMGRTGAASLIVLYLLFASIQLT